MSLVYLTLDGTEFSLDTGSVNSWLNNIYVPLSNLVSLVGNWTVDKPDYYNQTQSNNTYLKLSGGNMTGNINMSSYNITLTNGTNGGRLCLNQDCSSYIFNNGTGILIRG